MTRMWRRTATGVLLAVLCAPVLAGPASPPAQVTTTPSTDAEAAKAFDQFLGTDWHGVYLLGRKVGWMKSTFSRSPDGTQYELATLFHARFRTLGVEQVMEVQETRAYGGPGWRLQSLEMTQATGAREARMSGRVVEDGFEFTYLMAGQPATRRLPRPTE